VLHVTKAWNQLFYKLFRVIEQDCINDIEVLLGIKSISLDNELCSKRYRFIKSLANSTSTVL